MFNTTALNVSVLVSKSKNPDHCKSMLCKTGQHGVDWI